MSSTPIKSNVASNDVPVSVFMDVNASSDSEVEQIEQEAMEKEEQITTEAQEKAQKAKMVWEEHWKERMLTMATVKEAMQKAVEVAEEHIQMHEIEVSCRISIGNFGS